MKSLPIKGLYAIADAGFDPYRSLPKLAAKYLSGGCRLLQLRIKTNDARSSLWNDEAFEAAKEILKLKKSFDFTFIVNDYVDVAAELKADGIHVGANDMPVGEIRDHVGDRLIIGYSSHSYEEAVAAEKAGADYVALGAIYPTATKGYGHPVVGIETLKRVTATLKVPVVAIGGIKRENYREVFDAGASACAMITALTGADDVIEGTRWFVQNAK